jgi:hypothetical protein
MLAGYDDEGLGCPRDVLNAYLVDAGILHRRPYREPSWRARLTPVERA